MVQIPSSAPSIKKTFLGLLSATVLLAFSFFAIDVRAQATQAPYGGTPHTIPGTIQAENYDTGGQGVAYSDSTTANSGNRYRTSEGVDLGDSGDTGGGYIVGWTTDGEWIEYTVNVAAETTYRIDTRIASPNTGKTMQVSVDGTVVRTLAVPKTGSFATWQTASLTNVPLTAGVHVIRLTMVTGTTSTGGGFNLNYFAFTATGEYQNIAPTANAGSNQSITLPTNSVSLTGTGTDIDGTIASYAWTKVSGGAATITSPSSAATSVTGLQEGAYTFRLTVTDNQGAIGTDDMDVTVNPLPPETCPAKEVVIMGSSTSAGTGASPVSNSYANLYAAYLDSINPANTMILRAAGGYTTYQFLPTGTPPTPNRPAIDPNRNITHVIGLNPDAIILNLPSNDTGGGYSLAEQQANFDLITDAADAAGIPIWITTTQPRNFTQQSQRTMQMTMRDWINTTYAPRSLDFWTTLANADGTINATYNSGDGIHVNNAGHSLLANRVINSNLLSTICGEPVNQAPNANAGTDQTITLPTNSASLSASATDADGTIASYAWTKVSGGAATITSPSSAATMVTGLAQGSYTFRVTATDDDGATDTDDVVVTVNPEPVNNPPVANAGNDQNINLPTDSATLTGSATDSDGTIASYAWTMVSGPGGTIVSPATASTDVTGLSEGAYTFWLTVTDDDGATDTDSVVVTVLPEAANVPPTANAGIDKLITLPTATTNVVGSGTDTDGTVTAYAWSFISGPATPTIVSPTSSTTSITDLTVAGTYTVRLTVTDNESAEDTDDVVVTVNPEPANVPPTANAGVDQTITLPATSVSLSGSGSDTDGTVVSYAWTKVSGGTATITSPSTAATTVTGLSQGSYVFRLTTTDDDGATGTDDMTVTVNPSGLSGLVARYTLDTANINWADTTSELKEQFGAHANATGLAAANVVAGKIGESVNFTGTQFASSTSAASFVGVGSSYTATAWVYLPTVGANMSIFSKSTTANREMQLFANTNSTLSAFVGGTSHNSTGALPANQWIHVALVNNASTGQNQIYVNGVLNHTGTNGTVTAPGIDFMLGARRNNSNTDSNIRLTGRLDDVRIYNRVLTATEIASIFNLTN